MGLFDRTSRRQSGEHLPAFIPTECIGDWMSAGGPTEKHDTTKPPLKDVATYIIYGQRCLAGAAPKLVAQRVEIYKPEQVNDMQIIALTGRYGDMPIQILNGEQESSITTIASSESE